MRVGEVVREEPTCYGTATPGDTQSLDEQP